MKSTAKIFVVFCISAFFTVAVSASAAPESPREKYNFNSDWKLFVGDASGTKSTLGIIEVEIYRRSVDIW